MKISKKTTWILAGLLVVALLAVPRLLPRKAEAPHAAPGKGKAPAGQIVSVGVKVVRAGPISETMKVPGTVIPNEQVELKAEASGRIVRLLLREGTPVKKGGLLLKIYDADLQAQLAKATAAFKLAEVNEVRQKTLLEKELISRADYDYSQKELAASRADIELVNAQIVKTEVRAPFDGQVGLKYVSEGAFVSAGTKIADFVGTRPLKVEFSVPERYAGRIGQGTVVRFSVQGSATEHPARVFALQPSIDEASRTLRMRAVCTDGAQDVVPGSFAEVNVSFGEKTEAVTVPSEAVVPDIKGQKVYLVRAGRAAAVPVTTGVRDARDVEIASGIKPGDTVVTTGVLMVRPGMAVTIKTFE